MILHRAVESLKQLFSEPMYCSVKPSYAKLAGWNNRGVAEIRQFFEARCALDDYVHGSHPGIFEMDVLREMQSDSWGGTTAQAWLLSGTDGPSGKD